MKRGADPITERWHVRALSGVNDAYVRILHQPVVYNRCPLPATGPAILACNHTAGLDPAVLQAFCDRPVIWMMARDYYEIPQMRWLFEMVEAIPVSRNGKDQAAMREAMRRLEEGRVVGVFPEGRIERTRELMPFAPGVAVLARRAKATIYPAYIDGLQRNKPMVHCYLTSTPQSIVFGQPIEPGRLGAEEMTAQLREEIDRLRRHFPSPRRKGRSPLRSVV